MIKELIATLMGCITLWIVIKINDYLSKRFGYDKQEVNKMGKIILTTTIKMEPGVLYYCRKNEQGFLCVYQASLQRGRKKEEQKSNV